MYGILLSIFYAIVKTTFKTVGQWVATKTFFTTLLLIAFPIVLNNFLGRFLEKILTKVSESITSGTGDISSITYNFTGLSAFFINHMFIDDALSIVFSALATRFILSLIPFSRI